VSVSHYTHKRCSIYRGVTNLYRLYAQAVSPKETNVYNVTNKLQAVANLSDDDFNQLVETGNDVGINALLRLFKMGK